MSCRVREIRFARFLRRPPATCHTSKLGVDRTFCCCCCSWAACRRASCLMDSVYTFGEREVDVPPTGEACSALVKPVTPAALTWHKPAVCALQTVDDATHARLMSQVRRREGQRKRNSKPKWMYATPLVFAPLLPMTRIALRYAGCRAAGRVRCRGLAWAKAPCTRCGLTIFASGTSGTTQRCGTAFSSG